MDRLGKDLILRIVNNFSSKSIFSLILNNSKWFQLMDRIDKDIFSNILKKSGVKKILGSILDDDVWSLMQHRLGLEDAKKFVNFASCASVYDVVLVDKYWFKFKDRFTMDSFIKLCSYKGSICMFNCIFDNDNWSILSKRLGESFLKVACNDGSRNVLQFFLDSDKWFTLLGRLGINYLIDISSHIGSRNVLEILFLNESWDKLIDRLGILGIYKVSNHKGARSLLNLFLDNSKWAKLEGRLGKVMIIKLASCEGAKNVLDLFLDDDKWHLLLERLGKQGLLNLSFGAGSILLLKMFLDNKKWFRLVSILGKEKLLKYSHTCGFRSFLELALDPKKWSKLLERLGTHTVFNMLSNMNVKSLFLFFLQDKNWFLLDKIFGPDRVKYCCSSVPSVSNLKNLFSSYSYLSLCFDSKNLYRYLLLPSKDQLGLTESTLSVLSSDFCFKPSSILLLTRLSGRHLPYLLSLFQNEKISLLEMFETGGFPSSFCKNNFECKVHDLELLSKDRDKRCFFWLALLNKFCPDSALSLRELQYLRHILPLNLSDKESWTFLKNILSLTGLFSSSYRVQMYEYLKDKNWIYDSSLSIRLKELPLNLHAFLIESGMEFGLYFFDSFESGVLPDRSWDLEYMHRSFMKCLKYYKIRYYFIERFNDCCSEFKFYKKDFYLSDIREDQVQIFVNKPFILTIHDWFCVMLSIYKFMDLEILKYKQMGSVDYIPSFDFFSTSDLQLLMMDFPNICWGEDSIVVDMKGSYVFYILNLFKTLQIPSVSPSLSLRDTSDIDDSFFSNSYISDLYDASDMPELIGDKNEFNWVFS